MVVNRMKSEAGTSLAEVLVTIVILGTAIAGIVAGLGSVSMTADRHRKEVNADTVVRSYAEAIKKQVAMGLYRPCATTSSYLTPTWTPPDGYGKVAGVGSTTIASVQYWHSASTSFTGTCVAGSDEGAQMLNLQSQSSDGRDQESLSIVVRTP